MYTISEATIQVRVQIQNWKVHMRTISEDSCTPTCTGLNIRYAHDKLCNLKKIQVRIRKQSFVAVDAHDKQ